mmetsp:Transcript_34704/g.53229  ORF Transcript_34704/g.53229 Transcript_34704/m.53229 type:complete len:157 (-) Transcript_34704:1234-1704(-)
MTVVVGSLFMAIKLIRAVVMIELVASLVLAVVLIAIRSFAARSIGGGDDISVLVPHIFRTSLLLLLVLLHFLVNFIYLLQLAVSFTRLLNSEMFFRLKYSDVHVQRRAIESLVEVTVMRTEFLHVENPILFGCLRALDGPLPEEVLFLWNTLAVLS